MKKARRKNEEGFQAIEGVLTNLKDDPGEVTNVAQDEAACGDVEARRCLIKEFAERARKKTETV